MVLFVTRSNWRQTSTSLRSLIEPRTGKLHAEDNKIEQTKASITNQKSRKNFTDSDVEESSDGFNNDEIIPFN
ncbi:18297_t:CDS:2 [Entrophospora sp. SA101]|nr:18297_t:CDS:2 [Entrophospora sp. SA101]